MDGNRNEWREADKSCVDRNELKAARSLAAKKKLNRKNQFCKLDIMKMVYINNFYDAIFMRMRNV